MNCLRFSTKTGLVAMVAVLIVGGLMPAVASAAEDMGLFDPFALDAMIQADMESNVTPVVVPVERPTTVLRTPKLVIPQRPKLRSPFRPEHQDVWL